MLYQCGSCENVFSNTEKGFNGECPKCQSGNIFRGYIDKGEMSGAENKDDLIEILFEIVANLHETYLAYMSDEYEYKLSLDLQELFEKRKELSKK